MDVDPRWAISREFRPSMPGRCTPTKLWSRYPKVWADEQVLFAGDILTTAYTGVVGVNPDGNGIRTGTVVAVFGCGPVGLCAVAVARLVGAAQIIALDKEDYRLSMASRLGADKVINVSQVSPAAAVMDITDGWGADLVVEAVGSPETLAGCLATAATGGTVSVIGLILRPVEVPFNKLLPRNITIQTGLGNFIHAERLIGLIQAGKLDLPPPDYAPFSSDRGPKGLRNF